jgi:hypothetical protein
MSTTRKPKALIDAEKKIAELEKALANEKQYREMYSKQASESNAIIEGIHDLLTDLGVREFRDENKYQKIPLSVRLFAWAMSLATKGEQK